MISGTRIIQTVALVVLGMVGQMTRPQLASAEEPCILCLPECPPSAINWCMEHAYGCGLFEGSCVKERCDIAPGPDHMEYTIRCGSAS